MDNKLLLLIVDGVPWHNFRRYFGNLEAWVEAGEARVWKSRSCLPSISGPCYATIHTGVDPVVHGCTSNNDVTRLDLPDIFSEVRKAGGVTASVTHSFWSEFFNRAPFVAARDIEYDEPDSTSINHGRFHTMTGAGANNKMSPSDYDLFATISNLIDRFGVNYCIYHSCTLDNAGHQFGHDCSAMDSACNTLDAQLAPFIKEWRSGGYEIIVTADHGQSQRGHHGGAGEDQQDTALYYFGPAQGPDSDALLTISQIAPTVLSRLGVPIPPTMTKGSFLV
ncbi:MULTISPECIES: alkaline phosphatase family protein [unclassified Phaeobacter]|uniref:alkaline phosphatase family protein n=1 Tax=unclassified Phaeobacter TaxID=2621772 RepID=UPI003A8C32A3